MPLTVRSILYDASKKTIGMVESAVKNGDTSVNAVLTIQNPRLWNSRQDPYLYKIVTQLREQGKVVDEVEQPLGLRYYRVSSDSGLFLNGRYLDLYGFGLHEDVAGKGSAMSRGDFKKDIDLVLETGANALRFTHYPHSGEMYRLADSSGIILWSEIPLVGPGGYTGTGYMASASLQHQARQLMIEMIRQNYNHPSVFFWGLFNELKLDYDNPIPFLEELNALAKNEDPSRLTTCASFLDNDQFNHVSDLIAWNKYYGWYGGKFSDIGPWADKLHHQFPRKPIAISEYGAGAALPNMPIHYWHLFLPESFTLKNGRPLFMKHIGKRWQKGLISGVSTSGCWLILDLLYAQKGSAMALMIRDWLPTTGSLKKMLFLLQSQLEFFTNDTYYSKEI
ncbi:glycoside hydrolase family 2 TIM barrel-domain containing protein [Niabella hibiscisoli]|uniref:glycoside hydrolase family 2 TIM barrel-domain containing protein n=1 Tax=Niabella hibiscisoli TaxID=1825928 RepID=UPI001F111A0B|nr:glycoside hydrolase family 2 TIM barrel-domain containing protein [Niabella hibiscisoli]MCH5718375.1 hypothetical protein [Niabella hibiscisoli]